MSEDQVPWRLIWSGAVLAAFIFCTLVLNPVVIVPNGQIDVLTRFGAATGTEFYPGLHTRLPVVEATVPYPTYPQRVDLAGTAAASADLQDVHCDVILNYTLVPGEITQIQKTLGPDYGHTILLANVPGLVKAAISEFSAQDILQRRILVEGRALALVQQRIGQLSHGLVAVLALSLNDVQFSSAYTGAIEKKVVAQQDLLRSRIEAQARVAQAQGQAAVTLALAHAQAAAQKLQQKSLTPLYVQYQALQRWNGVLPTYNGGGALPFIPLPAPGAQPPPAGPPPTPGGR